MHSGMTRRASYHYPERVEWSASGTKPRPRRLACWFGDALRWLSALALALSLACHSDRRVSVAELTEMEQELPKTSAVAVVPEDLTLSELHPYQIGVGDILSVKMFGLTEEHYAATTLDLRVHADGAIVMPVVGAVKVVGLTLNQVEEAIIAAHVPMVVRDQSVYVQVLKSETTTVLVLGAVATPGFVTLKQNERNVLYALASVGGYGGTATAGGFSATTTGRVHFQPIRPDRPEVTYNLNDVNDVRRALLAPPLESGDVLTVEAADSNAVYICGPVLQPGPIAIPPLSTLSVLRAVAAAGGVRDYLGVKEATLVRAMPDGEQVQVKLDLSAMLAGRTPDLALRPGDILSIPYTADTFFQEWFLRNMVPGPFNVSLRYDPLAQYNANRALQNQGTGNSLLNGIRSSLGSTVPSAFIPPVPTPAAAGQ